MWPILDELGDYFTSVTGLVEELVESTGGPVVLLVHSLGAPVMNYFLNTKTQQWRSSNIHSLVSLAGAWGGAAKAYKVRGVARGGMWAYLCMVVEGGEMRGGGHANTKWWGCKAHSVRNCPKLCISQCIRIMILALFSPYLDLSTSCPLSFHPD